MSRVRTLKAAVTSSLPARSVFIRPLTVSLQPFYVGLLAHAHTPHIARYGYASMRGQDIFQVARSFFFHDLRIFYYHLLRLFFSPPVFRKRSETLPDESSSILSIRLAFHALNAIEHRRCVKKF